MKTKIVGATCIRVLFGLIILKDLINYISNYKYLIGENTVCSLDNYLEILKVYDILFLFIDFTSFYSVLMFFSIAISACVLWIFGYKTIITGVILYFCLITIRFICIFMQDGADNLIYIMIPLISFLHGNNIFSGKKINNYKNKSLKTISFLASLGILIQLSFVYFFGALSKISNPYWYNGEALYYILRVEDFLTSFLNVELTKSLFFVKTSTYLTLLWEFSFGLLIWWSKKIRIFYVITGVMLHLSIWMFMRIDNFSFVMISIYPFLVYDHEYIQLVEWFKKRYFNHAK